MQSIRYLTIFPGDVTVTGSNQPFATLDAPQQVMIVPAESVYENLDVIEKTGEWLDNLSLQGQVIPGVVETLEENTFSFDSNRDAVYEVRMINPVMIWMWGTTDTEWGFLAQHYPNEALKVHALNVLMAIIDGLDILIDIEDEPGQLINTKELMIKVFVKTVGIIAQEFPNGLNMTLSEFAMR